MIVATSSPDDLFGDATSVAAAIGAKNAVAYDLTAACSGFLFATVTASQFLHSGTYKKAVVVGADALSRCVRVLGLDCLRVPTNRRSVGRSMELCG